MRVGSLVFSTCQGLGILAKSFYDAGIVTDIVTIAHGRRTEHPEWYPNALHITSFKDPVQNKQLEEFCSKMDVMLFFETPFRWELLPFCRRKGVKTFLMPMYECEPKEFPYQPDRFLNPSLLDQQYFPHRSEFLPIPVHGIPWKQRTEAKVFVHNAGHGGLKGRNGTKELSEAMKYVRSPIDLIIRSQDPLNSFPKPPNGRLFQSSSCIKTGETIEREWLYDAGDVFLFPEKFNGLSLPLQEARAAGMLVMSTNRFPMNTWLPTEPLIPVERYQRNCVAGRCLEFDEAVVDPRAIAAKIDSFYGQDISAYSLQGKEWAKSMSWEIWKPKYLEALRK